MPGTSDGRRRLASSERGFSMGTVCGDLEEDGRPSPPPRAKALVGDPGSDDAHTSESMYGAPMTSVTFIKTGP